MRARRRARRSATKVAIGAAMAYFGDPTHGPARRARAKAILERGTRRFRTPRAPTDATSVNEVRSAFRRHGLRLVDHTLSPDGEIVCGACGHAGAPETYSRLWRHRTEGASEPGASETLSGLRCPSCGEHGLLLLPYGPQADEVQADVAVALPSPDTERIDEVLRHVPLTSRVKGEFDHWRERVRPSKPRAA